MNYLRLFILCVSAAFIVSCGGGNKADNRLGKLELEIPDELKDNKEVVEYIENMAAISDEYAIMIDNVLEDVGNLAGKDEADLSMFEKLKLVKATGQITLGSAEIMVKWGEYMEKRQEFENVLNDDQLKAMGVVMERFEKRMEQINQKYGELSTKES